MLKLNQTTLSKVESLQNQFARLEMQTPPHTEPLSSIGFVKEPSEPQFFSTLDMDDDLEIQPMGVVDTFAPEIGIALLNIQFGQTRPFVQSSRRIQFGAKQGRPHFRIFS